MPRGWFGDKEGHSAAARHGHKVRRSRFAHWLDRQIDVGLARKELKQRRAIERGWMVDDRREKAHKRNVEKRRRRLHRRRSK